MGGADRPYLYSNTRQTYTDPFGNGFDPKAVTRASWAPPPPPKPKQEGPLINFNRHPDSWRQAPYGMTNALPMPPNTKRNVKAARWVQLALRVIILIGAIGALVCLSCLSNIPVPASWIVRIAPSIDIIATSYGIIHLIRPAKGKPPASSASYHVFAIIVDLPLIFFYVYIALNDKWNVTQSVNNRNRWKSLFGVQTTTDLLIDYTWIIAVVVGGFHLVTVIISAYLVRMFRKIANLPPDLNPLEDNLTSRRKSKHKHKNSDMTKVSEQHSKHDSGISLPWEDQIRPMSFMQTRNESTSQVYSPHNPKTANESRASLPIAPSIYSQPSSERSSRVNVSAPSQPPPRTGSPLKQTELSRLNSVAASSVYSEGSNHSAPALPRKSSKRQSGTFTSTENWYAINDGDDSENNEPAFSILEEEDEDMSQIELNPQSSHPYQPVRQSSMLDIRDGDLALDNRYAPTPPPKSPQPSLHPLNMNPPTPPPQTASRNSPRPNSRANTPAAPLITTSGNTSPTRDSPSPTKGRYYGDLKSAVQGVRNGPKSSPQSKSSRIPFSKEPGLQTNEWLTPTRNRATEKRQERAQQSRYERLNNRMDGQGRIVSRSGADLGDGGNAYWEDVPSEFQGYQGNNARNVSGKMVEEGWGGGWARRRISGR